MTDRYAVIGNPIVQSLSPIIHRAFAKQTGENITYSAILAPLDSFAVTVHAFQKKCGKGLNVTAPFKEEAYQLAEHSTECAQKAQAVNTLWFETNGKIYGDNTDGEGFIEDVYKNQKECLEEKRILILGAGGAIRGLLGPIMQRHPKTIVIANRTLSKTESLLSCFTHVKCPILGCSLASLTQFSQFDWIINGIARGVDITPLLPRTILSPDTGCYDLSYGAPSPFLTWAKQNGSVRLLDGLGILVEQAALSFYRWRGVKPETAAVLKELRQKFQNTH